MKAQVNTSVGHLDAKHILILISGDNKIPDLIRMQPEIKTFQHTRNTIQTARSESGFCVLKEFQGLTTDL